MVSTRRQWGKCDEVCSHGENLPPSGPAYSLDARGPLLERCCGRGQKQFIWANDIEEAAVGETCRFIRWFTFGSGVRGHLVQTPVSNSKQVRLTQTTNGVSVASKVGSGNEN